MTRRNNLTLPALAVLGLVAAWPVGARAADFEFAVPIEVKNLSPAVIAIVVQCMAMSRRSIRHPVGSGYQNISLGAGTQPKSWRGVIRVHFNAKPGRTAAQANFWHCNMKLMDRTNRPVRPSSRVRQGIPGWAISQPGTPLIIQRDGKF